MNIDADDTKEEIESFAKSVGRHCLAKETIECIGDMLPTGVVKETLTLSFHIM